MQKSSSVEFPTQTSERNCCAAYMHFAGRPRQRFLLSDIERCGAQLACHAGVSSHTTTSGPLAYGVRPTSGKHLHTSARASNRLGRSVSGNLRGGRSGLCRTCTPPEMHLELLYSQSYAASGCQMLSIWQSWPPRPPRHSCLLHQNRTHPVLLPAPQLG